METLKAIPTEAREIAFVERLCTEAVLIAMERHAGRLRRLYGRTGGGTVAEGKDLTQVKYIIGTGGALTRLPSRVEIMKRISNSNKAIFYFQQQKLKY